jgi:large subunit ribosomal protein L29
MKIKEIKALSDTELQNKVQDLRRESLNLRIQQQSGQIEKPSRLREIRRTIARSQTVLNERKIKTAAVAK